MGLASNALVALADLEDFLGGVTFQDDTSPKAQAERAINVASQTLERLTGRVFVNATALTEYHTISRNRSRIELLDWPVQTVTSIHEDPAHAYGAATALVAGTDYTLVSDDTRAEVIRISGGDEQLWSTGYRVVRVMYKPGYAATTNVPADLADLCLELAARIFKETDRKTWGLSGQADAAGNWQRFSPGVLTPQILDRVANFKRAPWGQTGERDS